MKKRETYIDNWHGKPIGELSRGELIDALDWCMKQMRPTARHKRFEGQPEMTGRA